MCCPASDNARLDKHRSCPHVWCIWLPEELVREQLARSLAFTGGYSERHCPACDETMDQPLIFDVPIDRCVAHECSSLRSRHGRSDRSARREAGTFDIPIGKR
jgi:hypothetical protein